MLLVVKGDNLSGRKNPNPTKHGPIKGGEEWREDSIMPHMGLKLMKMYD